MPRYFFDVDNDVSSPDLDGVDLADLRSARQEACRMAGRLLEDRAAVGSTAAGFMVTVREGHDVRLTVTIDIKEAG